MVPVRGCQREIMSTQIGEVSQDSTFTVPEIVLGSQSYLPTRGRGTNRPLGLHVPAYGSFCSSHRVKLLAELGCHGKAAFSGGSTLRSSLEITHRDAAAKSSINMLPPDGGRSV